MQSVVSCLEMGALSRERFYCGAFRRWRLLIAAGLAGFRPGNRPATPRSGFLIFYKRRRRSPIFYVLSRIIALLAVGRSRLHVWLLGRVGGMLGGMSALLLCHYMNSIDHAYA